MLNNAWMARYGTVLIVPEYFEQDDEEMIARAIIEYRTTYGISPTDPEDIIVMAGSDDISDTVYELYDGKDYDTDLAADLAVQFAKEQAAKVAVLDSIDDISKGDLQSVRERIEQAAKIGDDITSPGIDPVADIDKWLYDYWLYKVPTRMTHVDRILEGGLNPGELGIMMAPQNVGKSMALVNIGYGAASIGSARHVVHFTHEMDTAQTAKRYSARMLFRFPKRTDDLDEYADDLIEAARRLMPGKIRIIKCKTTHEIESHMDRLEAEGFDPDLIIDDYPDLITPPRKYTEHRFELSATYDWLRELGSKYHCPVWGASQARRESHSKEIITLAEIAEDIGKASIADVIISICQTYEESEANQCRLFMAKVRDNKNHSLISAKFYSDQQAIITTGYIISKEESDA
jgi:replicative DNA helicase